jgi:hypothetical protein
MAETRLRERTVEPASRPRHTSPPVRPIRKIPYWRRRKRILIEHWVAGAIVALAYANAVRLLLS